MFVDKQDGSDQPRQHRADEDLFFQDRYLIKNRFNEGSFGQVFKVVDTKRPTNNLIAKIQCEKDLHRIETGFLNDAKLKFERDLEAEIKAQGVADL